MVITSCRCPNILCSASLSPPHAPVAKHPAWHSLVLGAAESSSALGGPAPVVWHPALWALLPLRRPDWFVPWSCGLWPTAASLVSVLVQRPGYLSLGLSLEVTSWWVYLPLHLGAWPNPIGLGFLRRKPPRWACATVWFRMLHSVRRDRRGCLCDIVHSHPGWDRQSLAVFGFG